MYGTWFFHYYRYSRKYLVCPVLIMFCRNKWKTVLRWPPCWVTVSEEHYCYPMGILWKPQPSVAIQFHSTSLKTRYQYVQSVLAFTSQVDISALIGVLWGLKQLCFLTFNPYFLYNNTILKVSQHNNSFVDVLVVDSFCASTFKPCLSIMVEPCYSVCRYLMYYIFLCGQQLCSYPWIATTRPQQ